MGDWKDWFTKQTGAGLMHPDAPAGGTGPGASRPSGPDGSWVAPGGLPHPDSPDGRRFHWSIELPQFHLRERVREIWLSIMRTSNSARLIEIARDVLRGDSLELGICVGIFENVAGSAAALAKMGKIFLLAGLYDQAHSNSLWQLAIGPGMIFTAEAKAIEYFAGTALKEAYDQRSALLSELHYAVFHLHEVFGEAAKEYETKWTKFKIAFGQGTITGNYEAGKIAGDVLMDVLTIVLTVVDGVGLVRMAAKLPEVLKLADSLSAVKGLLAERRMASTMVRRVEEAEELAKARAPGPKLPKEPVPEVVTPPEETPPKTRRNRRPSEKNKNIDSTRTTRNADGSTTYYDKQGRGVTYNKDGYPDFSPYAEAEVKIDGLKGTMPPDDNLANQAVGLDETPDGYTWHHVEDGQTMQLVPSDIHNNFPHTGGASKLKLQN